MKADLTADQAREVFAYDTDRGVFTWKVQRGSRLPGTKVGSVDKDGYLTGRVYGKTYFLHRLAWLYVTGEWPRHEIDHMNGNKSDNSFANLRDVPRSVNAENLRAARKNSRSGMLGVARTPEGNWKARIRVHGRLPWSL